MDKARRWNRSRDLEALGVAVVCIANRIPFNESSLDIDQVLSWMPGYEPPPERSSEG